MKRIIIACLAAAVSGCASTPPAHIPIENSRRIALSKDVAWSNLVEHFAAGNITIKTIERDSGIIYAERMFGTVADVATFADCGVPGMSVPISSSVDLNVFVREVEGGVNATVNASFRQQRRSTWDNSLSTVECASLGTIERSVLSAIAGR